MASGKISKYITGREYRIEWQSVGDINTNTSTITCNHYLINDNSYSLRTGGGGVCSCSVGNTYEEYTAPAIYTDGGQTHHLGTTTHTVAHNNDGTKSVTITGVYAIQSYLSSVWYPDLTATGTITLDDIPRQANINTAPNFTDDENPKITYTNSAGNKATTLQACISLNGSNDDIAYRNIGKTSSSYTFSLTSAEREVLRKATTTSNSRTIYFLIKTVIGSNTFYSKIAKTLTIADGTPTLSPTVEDTLQASLNYTQDSSVVIKGYNKMSAVSGAKARKNATLTSVKITCGSMAINATSGVFENAESGKFVFTATDSRGNTVSKTINLTLIDYVKLTCNFTGNPPSTEGVFTFSISGKYFPQKLGETANNLSIQYRYKGTGNYSDWITLKPTLGSNYSYEASETISGLDYQTTYTFQAKATDLITEVYTNEIKVKTTPVFDWGKDDFNFNVPVSFMGNTMTDMVIEEGSSGNWKYRKWLSGRMEAWNNLCRSKDSVTYSAHSNIGGIYRWIGRVSIPSGLFKNTEYSLVQGTCGIGWWNSSQSINALTATSCEIIYFTVHTTFNDTNSPSELPLVYVCGSWK